MPGFRKGKAPPSLVIQRVGFAAVLEEAIREALPEWYERALLGSGVARSAIPASRSSPRPRPRASRSPSSSRSACGQRPSSASTRASRWAGPSPRPPEEIVDREIERIREGFAKLEPVERAAAEGDVLLVDFEGLLDGKAFEGGKASDYLLELGGGQLIEGFEEQLAGGQRRRDAQGRGHLSRRLPGRAARRRRRGLHGRGQGGAGEGAARARRRLRLRGLRVRHAGGAARRHRRAPRRGGRPARRAGLPRRRGRRRGCRGDGRASRRARHRPRRRALGAGRAPARCPRHEPRRLPADAGQNPRGGDRGVQAGRRSGAEARGGAGRDRRCRGDRGLRGGDGRGARAHRRARADDAREAAGAAARERPRRDDPRGHPLPQGDRPGRRGGEADPARAGRGARADLDAGEGARGGGQLWTPGSE